MRNITLLCTQHDEKGACSSYELCKILETIHPQVIFEELPPSVFDAYYKEKTASNLETDAIHLYMKNHPVTHIPVDYLLHCIL